MPDLILFNKPFRVLSQFTTREANKQTLSNYLSDSECQGFYPAGRLDFDSEGLVVLTNDGRLQHRIASPDHKLPKTYWVQVEGEVSDAALQQLRQGVMLNDGATLPAQARIIDAPRLWERHPPIRTRARIPSAWLELTLLEGRNRQVRRMTAAVGLPTLRLVRYRVGHWTLAQLAPGEFRKEVIHLPQLPTQAPQRQRRQRK